MRSYSRVPVVVTLIAIGSCASTGVDYPYYVLHPEVSPEMLYAKDPKNNVPVSVCDPDPQCSQPNPPDSAKCGKCIVMIYDQFFKKDQELKELRKALQECENPPPGDR